MRILPYVFIPLLFVATPGSAQTAEAEVEHAIERLFDAMRTADGAVADGVFHPEARLHSVSEQNGRTVLSESDVAAFVQAIGTPRSQVWDERVWNFEVRVDGGLATAWMDYAFYLDDTLSHCGVNAFQLVRLDGRWQILQITDTRRQTGCDGPP